MSKRFLAFLLLFISFHSMAQDESVVFSVSGGCYPHSFQLSLYCYYPNHFVRFTTDGSTPTASSSRYKAPLWLDEHLFSNSNIHSIPIAPDYLMYYPDTVQHAIVIRAAVFNEDNQCLSDIVTNTYLIQDLGCNHHDLAVLSICADSLDLFDYETGIFVPGIHWDPENPESSGNYFQRGMDWERIVNVEFYEPDDNSGINQICGLRTHGNRARRQPSKGMKIYAREEYGKKRFKHHFFDTTPIKSFKHLVIKPFSTLWPKTGTQDFITNQLALRLGLEAANSRPIVVYLNGEYWGIYFLQEKLDEHYLEDHFQISTDSCNIIGNWHGNVENGDNTNFTEMMNWLEYADLSTEQNYSYLCNLIDVDNYIDYQILETFIANYDWPANNMR